MQNSQTDTAKTSYTYSGPYNDGISIATHYGFELIPPPRGITTLSDEFGTRHPFYRAHYIDPTYKILIQEHLSSTPKTSQYMICHTRNARKKDGGGINLHVVGNNKGIAEALTIRTALAILKEYGYSDLVVDINSLGDKTAYKTFTKDLVGHYRSNISLIGDCCRTYMKNNPLMVAVCAHPDCQSVKHEAPHPINYLSESGREHFKGIIEYLESMNVTYRINNDLIGEHPESGTQVAFTIHNGPSDDTDCFQVLARGERYNKYIYKNQARKVVPSVGISIDIPRSGKEEYCDQTKIFPSVYLIHLGIEAKQRSLEVVELFRQKNIPIAQSLIFDDLAKQMRRAEQIRAQYMIIMGLKEARERAVIVRNAETRAQEVVPIEQLTKYVARIHRL